MRLDKHMDKRQAYNPKQTTPKTHKHDSVSISHHQHLHLIIDNMFFCERMCTIFEIEIPKTYQIKDYIHVSVFINVVIIVTKMITVNQICRSITHLLEKKGEKECL